MAKQSKQPKEQKQPKEPAKQAGPLGLINASNIIQKDGFYIQHTLFGASPATAANFGSFFIARHPMEVMRVSVVYSTASTSGTLQIEHLTGTTAQGSGSSILTAAFSTAATANTVQTKQGTQLTSSRVLKEGDRLALVDGGTLTNQTDLVITIYAKHLGMGGYR